MKEKVFLFIALNSEKEILMIYINSFMNSNSYIKYYWLTWMEILLFLNDLGQLLISIQILHKFFYVVC